VAILKTEAVVLKGWKLGETSKILSLLTRDYGKIKAVAKGGRSLKSKFRGCLEPLTSIRIVYYEKKTRDLQLLSQADLVDPHFHIIGDMRRTTLGLAAAELIDRALVGIDSHPDIFDLFSDILKFLDTGSGFLEGLLWYFENHFISQMGYKPTWDQCLNCDESLGKEGGFFQPVNGGLLCSRCGTNKGGLKVSGETLEILYWLQRPVLKDVCQLNPTRAQKFEIRKMFALYFRTHIDYMKSLRSLTLYYSMDE